MGLIAPALHVPFPARPRLLEENPVYKNVLRLMGSTTTLAVLVAVVEAGRKWF